VCNEKVAGHFRFLFTRKLAAEEEPTLTEESDRLKLLWLMPPVMVCLTFLPSLTVVESISEIATPVGQDSRRDLQFNVASN
jgi:hypothetical protein